MVRELHSLGVEPMLIAYFNYVRPGPVNGTDRHGNPIEMRASYSKTTSNHHHSLVPRPFSHIACV